MRRVGKTAALSFCLRVDRDLDEVHSSAARCSDPERNVMLESSRGPHRYC